MAESADFFTGDGARLSEEWEGFGPSFDGSWFDPSGSVADSPLCHQHQQTLDLRLVYRQAALAPRQPKAKGVRDIIRRMMRV
jgi:hypothetical protein